MTTSGRAAALAALLLVSAACALLAGMAVGSSGLPSWREALHEPATRQILFEIRLPRTLGALLAGGLLGLAGAVAQGLLRNPLADPYLLGSGSGAGLGVALLLVALGSSTVPALALQLGATGAAFVGALVGVLLTLALARGVQQTLRLLLAGVVVGVVLGAAVDLLTLLHPDILRAIQGFTLGNTGAVGWPACVLMALVLLPLLLLAWAAAPALDALALGETTAASLGLPLPQVRAVLVGVIALATGCAVAQAGLIAFVGLVAPHLVRAAAPVRHGVLLPLSALAGANLLAWADLAARWVVAPQELPVGVLTATLGGAYLLWLLHRGQRSQGGLR